MLGAVAPAASGQASATQPMSAARTPLRPTERLCRRPRIAANWVGARRTMGRPAHARARTSADTRVMDHEALLGEIGTLLASSSRDLELLERKLTDGYATALSLESTPR